MKARGTFIVSVCTGDPQKVRSSWAHSSLRTKASASANVGCLFWYQAAWRRKAPPCTIRRCANKVTTENSPKSAGVVRRMAISDHCLCVSNPRCLRTSWKVTSSCQRITNQRTIFCGSALRSVHRRAWVANPPSGSRTKTQRTGTANKPVEYHTAVWEAISSVRSPLPYQLVIMVGFHTVFGASATTERLGSRSPLGEASLSAHDDAQEQARRERHPA